MAIVNFFTLKWGTKYGPEYVNRLYNSVKQNYKHSFVFTCITDDTTGLQCNTASFRDYNITRQKCFTAEKLFLFSNSIGHNILLDLDTLILDDITEYLDSYNFEEPRFIKNYWEDLDRCELLATQANNYVNSSFVTWKDDQLKWLYDHFINNKELIEYKYGDLDFYLFQVFRKKLGYHPEGIVNTYGEVEDVLTCNYKMVLFNTSHGRGVELHDATGYARERWLSYS